MLNELQLGAIIWAAYLVGVTFGWFMSRRNLNYAESKGYAQGALEAWKKSDRDLIDSLRDHEASSVTICADNADFGGPNCAIEVCGNWTDFGFRTFHGETVHQCLLIAIEARDAWEKEQEKESRF